MIIGSCQLNQSFSNMKTAMLSSFMVPPTCDSSQCHTPIRWNMNPRVLKILEQEHRSGSKNVPDCWYLELEIFFIHLVPVDQVLTTLTVSTLEVPCGGSPINYEFFSMLIHFSAKSGKLGSLVCANFLPTLC